MSEQQIAGQEQAQAFDAEAAQQAAAAEAQDAHNPLDFAENSPAAPVTSVEKPADSNITHGRTDGSTEYTPPVVEPGKDPLDF